MKAFLIVVAIFVLLFSAFISLVFYFMGKMRQYDDTIEKEYEAIERAMKENEEILGI